MVSSRRELSSNLLKNIFIFFQKSRPTEDLQRYTEKETRGGVKSVVVTSSMNLRANESQQIVSGQMTLTQKYCLRETSCGMLSTFVNPVQPLPF